MLTLLVSFALIAQTPQRGEVTAALEAARRALESGDRAGAVQHALDALEHTPRSSAALALLLQAASEDADARAAWSHEAAAILADAKGRLKLDKDLAALLSPKDASVAQLAAARAAAADELSELAKDARKSADKSPESVVLAQWAAEVGREVVHASPEVATACGASFEAAFPLSSAARRGALDALQRKLGSAQASGDSGTAIEIARVLRGIAGQAGFKDLQGAKPPDLSAELRAASEALERARAELARTAGEPLSVEQLEAMDGESRDRFTREHASFATPGVALSPQHRYRVETCCGHATLLGAAATVELHHARLAHWYGVDPFLERQGMLRIGPEASDLESEGSPFWWAGGFQSGDVTTLRFSCGTIEGFGRGLTHELTHRFDGAVFPGLPAWLLEGRAVWTGAAYASSSSEEFVEEHALFGTIDDARFRGYGGKEQLEKLVRGTIEDYRDNYVAGYALFVFLRSAGDDPDAPRYAKSLATYLRTRRSDKRDPLDAFAATFCDGKEGRANFEAFAREFGAWVDGFYWRDLKPWTKRYVQTPGPGAPDEVVLDEPTWVWSRNRAEPFLGQDQARSAGAMLKRLGDEAGALDAYLWSLAVDERWNSVDEAMRGLALATGKRDLAWLFARALERRGLSVDPPSGASPLLSKLSKTRALLDVYRTTVASYGERGWNASAAILAADHDRIADALGLPLLAPSVKAPDIPAVRLHPFDEPRRSLMRSGWVEDGLTDYERHRVANLWCLDERDTLHVGRNQPRIASGTFDRAAGLHHAFARSCARQEAGRYRISVRIAPTSSFVEGAIVLGYERRDRNLRFHFSAGDYSYAIGDKEEPAELDHVDWSLDGLSERDYGLGGAIPFGSYPFGRTLSAFEVELAVDQAAVHVFLQGEHVGTYHTPRAMPIEGFVGFAVSRGDYKVTRASVQRLDRSAAFAPLERVPAPLDLRRWRTSAFRDSLNRRVLGLPLDARGTLVLWMGTPDPSSDGNVDSVRGLERSVERIKELEAICARQSLTCALLAVVPKVFGPGLDTRLDIALQGAIEPEFRERLTISFQGPATAEELARANERYPLVDTHQSWLLFVDSAGVLRAAESLHTGKRIEGEALRWIEVFRNR